MTKLLDRSLTCVASCPGHGAGCCSNLRSYLKIASSAVLSSKIGQAVCTTLLIS